MELRSTTSTASFGHAQLICPLCEQEARFEPYAFAPPALFLNPETATQAEHSISVFLKCGSCRSLVDAGRTPPSLFHGDNAANEHFVRIYLEGAAGIDLFVLVLDELTGQLPPAGPDGRRRILEIGGGLGLASLYARLKWSAEVINLDSGLWADFGQRVLGVRWEDGVLSEDFINRNLNSYDLVFGIEMIEHVPDPAATLSGIYRILKPGGLCLLTTPNAEFVKKENPAALVYGSLAPGEHRCVLSPGAMQHLGKRAGFVGHHVQTGPSPDRLVLCARKDGLPPRLSLQHTARTHEACLDFLRASREVLGEPYRSYLDPRIFQTLVQLGRFEEALAQAASSSLKVILEEDGRHLREELVQQALAAGDMKQYIEIAGFSPATVAYFLGMALLNLGQHQAAADAFGTALVFIDKEQSLSAFAYLFSGSLKESAQRHQAMSRSRGG